MENCTEHCAQDALAKGIYIYPLAEMYSNLLEAARDGEGIRVSARLPLCADSPLGMSQIIAHMKTSREVLDVTGRLDWEVVWFDGEQSIDLAKMTEMLAAVEVEESHFPQGFYTVDMYSCDGFEDARRSGSLVRLMPDRHLSTDTKEGLDEVIAITIEMLRDDCAATNPLDAGNNIFFWYDGNETLSLSDLESLKEAREVSQVSSPSGCLS